MRFGMHDRGCGPRGRFSGWERWAGPDHLRNVEEYVARKMAEGPRGPRSRRMFDGGELRLVLLALIADTPRHGYDLIREIEARTGGAYAPSPGVVYPTLTLLADMGLIEERESEGAKKLYGATPAGEAHLAEHADTVTALMGRLAELGVARERTDGGPVRRAMANLRTALGDRLQREGADGDLLHDVAAILDEAVQKIERL